ncbi:Hpt domain-containing protein [Adhaeribacter arboris]|uniref:Hpt domain-containing protein n=1 Tax=Adhaeribacter arboris TaxID=2072846 RepID=UPI00130490A5|nr:Hpt domain-containing protein [Adhaeribacter arboris]
MPKKKPAKIQSSPSLKTRDYNASPPEANYINLTYLQEIAGGDVRFMSDIIILFLQQSPENVKNLNFLAKQNDWENLRKLVHKMRSPITLVGIEKLLKLLTKLEANTSKLIRLESVPSLVNLFTEVWEKAVIELQIKLNNLSQNNLEE